MKAVNHYYITALPGLGELDSTPPLTPTQLLEHVADHPGPRALIESLFLFDDLLQREAFLSGEIKEVSPAVLTSAQLRNEDSLPAYLSTNIEDTQDIPDSLKIDCVWNVYFHHACSVARQNISPFLTGWISHEVALRNALATERAGRLGLNPDDYLVAKELADPEADLTALLNEWSAATTPLAGLLTLIKARWAWLAEHDTWFSFGNDELAVYAARLLLLHQWKRLAGDGQDNPSTKKIDTQSLIYERTAL